MRAQSESLYISLNFRMLNWKAKLRIEASSRNESMGVTVYSRRNAKNYPLISTESICLLLDPKNLLDVIDGDQSHLRANGIM